MYSTQPPTFNEIAYTYSHGLPLYDYTGILWIKNQICFSDWQQTFMEAPYIHQRCVYKEWKKKIG